MFIFSATTLSFILVWFIDGSPGSLGSDWVLTHAVHAFTAAILTFVYVIMVSEERLAEAKADHLTPQTIASIVLAALAVPLLVYTAIHTFLPE